LLFRWDIAIILICIPARDRRPLTKKVLFAILAVFTILGTVVCLGFALFYLPSQETVYDMSEASLSELTERATFQIADLEILERYAIKVIQESDGSNGMPEDSAYYVYDASAAVDEYTPWAEYYVVRFTDREKEYVASLTVSAGKNISLAAQMKNDKIYLAGV